MIRTDPEQSLRRAVLAVEKADTTTSAGALRDALGAAIVRKLWSVPLPRASAVAFSPDGRLLAGARPPAKRRAGSGSGTWRRAAAGFALRPGGAVVRWTPDGKGLVLGSGRRQHRRLGRVRGAARASRRSSEREDVEQIDDMD